MATYDVTSFLEDDSVVLEGVRSKKHPKGKAYRFASPDFETGLWLKNLIEFGRRVALGVDVTDEDSKKLILDDDEEVDTYRRVMGPTLDELRADGVSWGHVQGIFSLLLGKWGTGRDIAVTLREAAGEAATQPNRQARRANARSSSPKAGSKSSPASSATKARSGAPASTRSSGTSGRARAAKTG